MLIKETSQFGRYSVLLGLFDRSRDGHRVGVQDQQPVVSSTARWKRSDT